MIASGPAVIADAVAGLDGWLESMRTPAGYGGPVVHWWRDAIFFTDAALDWRYEGIITGYLNLFEATGSQQWLDKAIRAGDDLAGGQLPSGNFRNSGFELNPTTGGTPHESACDGALLRLALTLRAQNDARWEVYFRLAERNLQQYYIARLWDAGTLTFRDHPTLPSFVPNKASTLVEALFLLAEVSGDDEYIERYARPTVRAILNHQVRFPGDPYDGAIVQNRVGNRVIAKYFPYYIARCVPALVTAATTLGWDLCLESAMAAMDFVVRWRDDDGGLPQVVYPNGAVNRYPRWIAATGDVLRAMDCLVPHGLRASAEPTRAWLLQGRQATGSFRTAEGYASAVGQRPPAGVPDWRDILPVVGWSDKAFRWLTTQVTADFAPRPNTAVSLPCTFNGAPATYQEDAEEISVALPGGTAYRWRKGARWAEVMDIEATRLPVRAGGHHHDHGASGHHDHH